MSDDEASVDEEAEAARAGLRVGMHGGAELPAAIATSLSLCPQTSLKKKKKKDAAAHDDDDDTDDTDMMDGKGWTGRRCPAVARGSVMQAVKHVREQIKTDKTKKKKKNKDIDTEG